MPYVKHDVILQIPELSI